MATYGFIAAGLASTANLLTDKVRITTTSPIQFVASYPNVSGTGTITTSVSNANVTGSGTAFTTPGVGFLQAGYWIGNATGATVGIISSVANATFATLTTNGAVAIAGAGYKVNPYGVPYQEANVANSQVAPGNTQLNSGDGGQGNVISFINPTGITANVFTVTELGMPHRNSGTTGFNPAL